MAGWISSETRLSCKEVQPHPCWASVWTQVCCRNAASQGPKNLLNGSFGFLMWLCPERRSHSVDQKETCWSYHRKLRLQTCRGGRYLYQPDKREGHRKRENDSIWSLKVYNIEKCHIVWLAGWAQTRLCTWGVDGCALKTLFCLQHLYKVIFKLCFC